MWTTIGQRKATTPRNKIKNSVLLSVATAKGAGEREAMAKEEE